MTMLEVILKGHEKYYCVSDVVRLFYDDLSEDRDRQRVTAGTGPDVTLVCSLAPDGRSITTYGGKSFIPEGDPIEAGREIRRSLYLAMCELAGRTMPWGCLTGIRPTLVAYEEKTPANLIERYYVSPDKAELACRTAEEELRLTELIPEEDINIYVGIPFCPTRCSYCSFISQDISHHMNRLTAYGQALESEIRLLAPKINRRVSSLYVGGGTPTVLPDAEFASLLDCIYGSISIDDRCEVTIEAGRPDTITENKLLAMREHGITRICINPQTMNSDTLAKLNRKHTADDIVRVYEQAKAMGFESVNMDLIAGLPYETAEDFIKSLEKVMELAPANITIHTLYKKRRAELSKETVLDREESRGSLAEAVTEGYKMLDVAGYHPYYMYRQKDTGHGLENTGFAKGDTGCIYNVAMMTDMRDVLSFGAGSSSKRCFRQDGEEYKRRVERCFTTKNAIEYINDYAKAAQKKAEFFGL